MTSLRVGIVGLGMAGAGMIPALAQHGRCTLAGVAEPDPGLRERFAADHAVPVVEDIAALVARPDVDAVYIATPHQFHEAHTTLALAHGKHVVVEKPMALTLAGCNAMIAAAERSRRALVVGHTHGFDAPIGAMREFIASGEFGRLAMIAMWNYTDFLYRPRRAEELDTAQGGGILFNQIPHQIEIARTLAGSPVRSVRAMTGILDPTRPTEGCCSAFLEFADGVAATLVYSGYDRFDSDELHGWIGERGYPKRASHGATRRALAALGGAESAERRSRYGYGGPVSAGRNPVEAHQPHFGTLVVSCERADLRPTADGVRIYAEDGVRDLTLPPSRGLGGRDRVLDELFTAVVEGRAPVHDGHFGRATLATVLAIQESARSRREVLVCA